jgi:hypothetical protein
VYYLYIIKQIAIMTTQEIFSGITTSELIGYLAMGDNSKELRSELSRRASEVISSREGTVTNIELDAKYNG